MKRRLWIASALMSAAFIDAAPTPSTALLVLSKADQTLSIVDPATKLVVARMPSGPDPHEVVASSDGKLAFISNYGGGSYNTITILDLVQQRPAGIIDLGPLRGPHGLEFAGGKLYFTAEAAKAIARYDPTTQKLDWIMGTGQDRTHMLWVSRDLKTVVTSNVSAATVSVIHQTERPTGPPPGVIRIDWDETVVPVGRGDEGFDVDANEKELWTANAQDGTISVVDLASRKVVATLDANVKTANRLKFTRDGAKAIVSLIGAPELVVLDVASRTVVKRIPMGHGAEGVLMALDGKAAYIACTPDSYVAILDLTTLEVVSHFNAGRNPDGMAWAVSRP